MDVKSGIASVKYNSAERKRAEDSDGSSRDNKCTIQTYYYWWFEESYRGDWTYEFLYAVEDERNEATEIEIPKQEEQEDIKGGFRTLIFERYGVEKQLGPVANLECKQKYDWLFGFNNKKYLVLTIKKITLWYE